MYAKKLALENVGPISNAEFDFPFDGAGNPKPVVLVGQNGSGKSIVLSFVVNALLCARQEVFEDKEVEQGKVYKYRSPGYVRAGQHYYFGQVMLEQGFEVTEWQLDTTRKEFEEIHQFTPARKSWASTPEMETNYFNSNFSSRAAEIRTLLVVLVYDCDVRRKNTDKAELKRRVLCEMLENPVRTGIENLLSRETLSRARAAKPSFIDIIPEFTKQVRGNDVVVPELWEINQNEKANLCDWVCEHGTPDDFRGFGQLLDIIREVVPEDQAPKGG